ncbi:AP2/B3-like transcriptional factor family protein [Euphorbia peplus]|nr:AP2/B3-like transcriptional factor family protein [Euphorbia peplus]
MGCRSKDPPGVGNDRRPAVDRASIFHFYKIILSTTVEEKKLRIPYKFVKRFRAELTDVVDLVIPNGRVWKVRLSKAGNNIWFDDGWQNFAEHHSIGNGHFLLFGYRGLCSFNVLIFDATASEIEYPCDDEGPNYDEIFVPRNEVEMPDDSLPSKMPSSVILSPSSSSLKTKLSDASASKKDCGVSPSKTEQKLQIKRGRDGVSMVGRELENLSSRNNSPKVNQLVEIIDIDDNEKRREKLGRQRISKFDQPLAIKQEIGRVKCKSGETESSAEFEDKETEIVMTRTSKCIKTTPKTERAMVAASKYIPKNPYFRVVMREYNFQSNRMYVPNSFSGYLSGADKYMKLKVSDGREWEVRLYEGGRGRWDIGGGFRAFYTANNLKVGDICVFELLKNKEVLEVSIFRGSEDVTHER